jgi:hypothetical protein
MGKTSVKFLKDEISKFLTPEQKKQVELLWEVGENINREQLVFAYTLGVNERNLEDELLDVFESAEQIFKVND